MVLAPSAGVGVAVDASITHSVGEAATILLTNDSKDITQGFQQPRMRYIIREQQLGNGVKVYPVPAINNLTIELFAEFSRKYSITIISISGRNVFTADRSYEGQHWDTYTIPVSDYVKGLYFVRVRCSEGVIDRTFKVTII
jgi:hypothetical protein